MPAARCSISVLTVLSSPSREPPSPDGLISTELRSRTLVRSTLPCEGRNDCYTLHVRDWCAAAFDPASLPDRFRHRAKTALVCLDTGRVAPNHGIFELPSLVVYPATVEHERSEPPTPSFRLEQAGTVGGEVDELAVSF